jgi:DNA-binding NarL/FixJ family response regulator
VLAKNPRLSFVGDSRRRVLICDTQPATAEGVRTLLADAPDLQCAGICVSLADASATLRESTARAVMADAVMADAVMGDVVTSDVVLPDVVLLDKAFGMQAVLEWLEAIRDLGIRTAPVLWGVSVTEAEALRFLQSGARGILRKTAGLASVLACLRSVAAGRSWMEDCVFRDTSRADRYPRSELTAREQQVLELVEQGRKNKEIATELGIRPGTVKIHLKHIFEKTGIRGRYGLALNGWKDRGAA